MERFARLYEELEQTSAPEERLRALVEYFRGAPPEDAAWALHFLGGGRPKRLLSPRRLALWTREETGTPEWLFEECYRTVGDLVETASLLLPENPTGSPGSLSHWVEERLFKLAHRTREEQRGAVVESWRELAGTARLLWNRLLTGGFRLNLSRNLVVRALAQVADVEEATIAHRLRGVWRPSAEAYLALISPESEETRLSRPYPFLLPLEMEEEVDTLGSLEEWQVEWKWEGLRAQLVVRGGEAFLWSRGGDLVSERFPELVGAGRSLPEGAVLDGEILSWREGETAPLPPSVLERRLGRRKMSAALRREAPVVFLAHDLLEEGGRDLRGEAREERRRRLELLLGEGAGPLRLSPLLEPGSWEEVRALREDARGMGTEGLVLKRRSSVYGEGRRRGLWWTWTVEPYRVAAVLLYAEPGEGRDASRFLSYTLGLWQDEELVPVARTSEGLAEEEVRRLDAWIRKNTVEAFGPVRQVVPEQVFELTFRGVEASPRRKARLVVREPRIERWRADMKATEADRLEVLQAVLAWQREGGVLKEG